MRIGIDFNPRNVMIKEFVIDSTVFPEGWSWDIEDIPGTEKYGKILFTAQADTNQILKGSTYDPNELSYFISGTEQKQILGIFKGVQFFGTSDTTHFNIDTAYSQHNYSTMYLLPRDEENVTYKIPYMKSLGGRNIADSLIFQNELLLNDKTPSAKIANVYPNPIGQNSTNLQVVIDVLKDNTSINLKFIEPSSGGILLESGEQTYSSLGQYVFQIDIENLNTGTYLLVLSTSTNTDIWLVNIIK